MKSQWIVLANAGMARLFNRHSSEESPVLLEELRHPQSRSKGSALATDRPGREATDNSSGANRFEPRSDSRRKEHGRFAREIADRLDQGLGAGEFDAVWIFASNPFLGELKAKLSAAVHRHVRVTADVDLTPLSLQELEQRPHEFSLGKKRSVESSLGGA
jgi:protein required for attachment to host cells